MSNTIIVDQKQNLIDINVENETVNTISVSKNNDTVILKEEVQSSSILVPVKPVTAEMVVKDDYTIYVPLATDDSYGIVKKSDFIKTKGENQKITNSALYGDILTVERDGTTNKTVVNDGALYLEEEGKALYQTPGFIRLDDGNYNVYDLKFQYKNGTLAVVEDIPTKISELENDKLYITNETETDPTVPNWAKQTQKPNYTYSEIKDTPTEISHFLNDSGFVTNAVDNLVNYYTKNDITNILSTMSFISFEVVDELPEVGKSNVIYLVVKKSEDQSDIYDEYVWVENLKTFENLGNTQIDLSDYSTKEWVRNEIDKIEIIRFTPHVDEQGNLSWTNNGGLDNPVTVNIKGESGVYVGDEEPTDPDIKVWIDTDGVPDNPYMNIGTIKTNTIEPSEEASVVVNNRYIPSQDKTVTDFEFNIPKGEGADISIEQETGDSETSTMSQAAITNALEMKADAVDLSNLEAKALKTPIEAPTELQIVAIDTNNTQTLIDVPEEAIIYQTTGQNTDGSMSQKAVTDALENIYTKAEVDAKVSSVYKYKGNVNTFYDLSTLSDPVVGDVYNVLDTGSNYAWNGSEWDKLSETVDLSSYLTKTEASSTYAKPSDIPTKVSQLTNDSEFITSSVIPTKTSQLTNDSGFITKSGFSMRASSQALRFYYNEGDGENAIDIKSPDIPKHTLSLVPSGEQIPNKENNLDLNSIDYIKVGLYYCGADVTVQTLSNRPTDRAFMLEVYSPLSPATDNETTSQWVYRIRKLMTYTGDQYIQSVSSGNTVGEFTYGAWIKIANTNDIPSSADFVKTSGNQDIGGYKKFTQDVNVGSSLTLLQSPNGGIEIGRRDGTTSTPYIDFHTDGNAINVTDYNVRMIASGGTKGVNGDGTLNISAGKVTVNSKELAFKSDSSQNILAGSFDIGDSSHSLRLNDNKYQFNGAYEVTRGGIPFLSAVGSTGTTSGNIYLQEKQLLINWGYKSGSGNKTITLPKAYTHTNYVILTSCGYNASTSNAYGQYTDVSNSGFKIIGGANDASTSWMTIGYHEQYN